MCVCVCVSGGGMKGGKERANFFFFIISGDIQAGRLWKWEID